MNKNPFPRPKKHLGQHFLINRDIADKIVMSTKHIKDATVLEIGPGKGILTRALLSTDIKHLVCVELDSDLVSILKNSDTRLTLVQGDALSLNEEDIIRPKFKIVANLPYNIASLLIIKWLKKIHLIDEIIIMIQYEVALRIVAEKSTKSYGRLSVLSQMLCHCEILFNVENYNFHPIPKVMSSVIKLTPNM